MRWKALGRSLPLPGTQFPSLSLNAPRLSNGPSVFPPAAVLDQDECLMGTHDCSLRQFCVNTLGSFYCVSHTVLCAEGFILNMHRKCVGKREPPPAATVTALCSAPRQAAMPWPHAKGPALCI